MVALDPQHPSETPPNCDDGLFSPRPKASNLLVTSLVDHSLQSTSVESHLVPANGEASFGLDCNAPSDKTQNAKHDVDDDKRDDTTMLSPELNDRPDQSDEPTTGLELTRKGLLSEYMPKRERFLDLRTGLDGQGNMVEVVSESRDGFGRPSKLTKCSCNCKSTPNLCCQYTSPTNMDENKTGQQEGNLHLRRRRRRHRRGWDRSENHQVDHLPGRNQPTLHENRTGDCAEPHEQQATDLMNPDGQNDDDDDDQSYCCEQDTRLVHSHRQVECPWCRTKKSHSIECSHQSGKDLYIFNAKTTDDNIIKGAHEMDRCCVCCCGCPVPSNTNGSAPFSASNKSAKTNSGREGSAA